MLGVKHHRHVEGVHDQEIRHLAEGHVQEVGGVAEIVTRLDQLLAAAATLVV